ncbi:uncharacterized protein FJT64_006909 [Amphibalanus amphitrite]|uniref:NAD(P)-binding domain-containing protein n=1 Tax=Amphibalanus amphitrite TaxID=1232801 RepID=A0A6A4W1G8_AMPAM|nr:uncharacterized protein FJT64_006909 [Amphibalanus amphitrite]
MKVGVLGATGRTGQLVIAEALKRGHSVTAIARNPDKLKQKHDNLSVVKASIFSAEELTEAFRDHDAVVSALGFSRSPPVTGYTESMKAAVAAMRASSVKRLVLLTAFYTDVTAAQGLGFFLNLFVKFLKHLLTNMREMEQYLESDAGDLDWTVVRPGGLNSRAARDQALVQREAAMAISGAGVASYIPRANVARFMVEQLEDDRYVRKAVAIAVNS